MPFFFLFLKSSSRFRSHFALLLIIGNFFVFPAFAQADQSTLKLVANPGDIVFDVITIRNDQDKTLTYQTDTLEGQLQNGAVTPTLPDDFLKNDDSLSLSKWLTVEPGSFTVEAKSTLKVGITIRVPKNADPGNHYAVVRGYPSEADTVTKSNVLFLQPISLLVGGDATQHLTITSATLPPTYSSQDSIILQLRVRNDGLAHTVSQGTAQIIGSNGKEVVNTPITSFITLPGTSRNLPIQLNQRLKPGRYHLKIQLQYGDLSAPHVITSDQTFSALPAFDWRWSTAGVVIILLIAAGTVWLKRLRQKS